jgi:transcription elongation factor/antiterminator RfaH
MNRYESGHQESVPAAFERLPYRAPAGDAFTRHFPRGPAFLETAAEGPRSGTPLVSSPDGAAVRWYVVHTHPHAEDRVVGNLERQSFATFCPRLRKTVRHARKVTHVLAPLFPNYMFVRLDMKRDRWRSINGTHGVVRILTQGELPLAVPRGIVEALQARTGWEGVVDLSPSLKVGDPVRICAGPFAEFPGTLEHLDGAGRGRVLLDMMGRAVSVVVRTNMVAPAA